MASEDGTIVYTSQVCYTDEDMHALRRIRLERKRSRHTDPKAYDDWTQQEELIHDVALARYDEAKAIPKEKLAAGIRAAREPFCPPALGIEPPDPPAALSQRVREADSLFRGVEGSAPWARTDTPAPPPPMPVPWGAAQPQTSAPVRTAQRKKPL